MSGGQVLAMYQGPGRFHLSEGRPVVLGEGWEARLVYRARSHVLETREAGDRGKWWRLRQRLGPMGVRFEPICACGSSAS